MLKRSQQMSCSSRVVCWQGVHVYSDMYGRLWRVRLAADTFTLVYKEVCRYRCAQKRRVKWWKQCIRVYGHTCGRTFQLYMFVTLSTCTLQEEKIKITRFSMAEGFDTFCEFSKTISMLKMLLYLNSSTTWRTPKHLRLGWLVWLLYYNIDIF